MNYFLFLRKHLVSLILIFLSCLTFQSCTGVNPPDSKEIEFTDAPPTKLQIALVTEAAALRASYLMMKRISPSTGKGYTYKADLENIVYNETTEQSTVEVTLTWSGKRTELDDKRDECRVWGKLIINYTNRVSGAISAQFIPQGNNDWATKCAAYRGDEAELKRVLTFNPYEK